MEQLEEHIAVCKERIQKVIAQEGIKDVGKWTSLANAKRQSTSRRKFLSCELMKYNQTYMEKIQAAQSAEELVTLWQDIAENSFLNWYVNPEVPEEAINDFIAIGDVEKQKHLLVALLDKNQLYVNL